MTKKWTILEIQRTMPNVRVMTAGNTYSGRITIRRPDYASVYVQETGKMYDFSWLNIERALNNEWALVV